MQEKFIGFYAIVGPVEKNSAVCLKLSDDYVFESARIVLGSMQKKEDFVPLWRRNIHPISHVLEGTGVYTEKMAFYTPFLIKNWGYGKLFFLHRPCT